MSAPLEIIIDATPGLSEISVSLDGSILITTEASPGKYSIKTVAPQKSGVYAMKISQKDSLGQSKTTDSPTALTVTEKLMAPTVSPTFKNVKTTTV